MAELQEIKEALQEINKTLKEIKKEMECVSTTIGMKLSGNDYN